MISATAVKWPRGEEPTHGAVTSLSGPGAARTPRHCPDTWRPAAALAREGIASDYIVSARAVAFSDPHRINALSESH